MREMVGRGLTRPLGWRLDQLQRLRSLIETHEKDVLDALAKDLGKPPTEAFFEVVALLQEHFAAWLIGNPTNVACQTPKQRDVNRRWSPEGRGGDGKRKRKTKNGKRKTKKRKTNNGH